MAGIDETMAESLEEDLLALQRKYEEDRELLMQFHQIAYEAEVRQQRSFQDRMEISK